MHILIFRLQGESGANALNGPSLKDNAIKNFEKKFRDKTKNKWSNRDIFTPVPGKYTLIEMAADEEDVVDAGVTCLVTNSRCNIDIATVLSLHGKTPLL